jgi:hypothetical protein
MNRIALFTLLLAGCASPDSAPRPAPPMPPVPARTAVTARKATIAPLPPLPLGMVRLAPAAVTPDPALGIYPFGAAHYLVVARQMANSNLEMQWADTVTGPWNFLAGYGYTVEEQYVSAAIPNDWLPYHSMFVRAINTAVPASPGLAAVKGPPEIYTNHKLNIKGVVYRLVEISPPGTQFRMYRLIK